MTTIEKTITVRRSEHFSALLSQRGMVRGGWRHDDPPATTVGKLNPDCFGRRIVIRSGDFLGTLCGILVGASAHPSLSGFSNVLLHGQRKITLRDDTEALLLVR
jgi:hypothetical protein